MSKVAEWARQAKDLQRQLEAAQTREQDLVEALEADATDLWAVTNAIKEVIQAKDWIVQGRGPYEWDDDCYKEEAGRAFAEVLTLIARVQKPAANRFHSVLARTKRGATMAHLVEIPQRKCSTCGGKATHEVINNYSASVGFYCKRHATKKLKDDYGVS